MKPPSSSSAPLLPAGASEAGLDLVDLPNKVDFLANISHEIRTPMNAILGFAEILADELPPGEHREHAQLIVQASHGLLRIVNTIVDYGKMDAGTLTLHPAPIRPGVLISETLAQFENAAREKGLLLQWQMHESLAQKIYLDEMRLREILLHLLDNAVKFTAAGTVRLTARFADGGAPDARPTLVLEVADTGPGLPPSIARQFFSTGPKLRTPPLEWDTAQGLGLAFCCKLARLLGGILDYRPSTTGVGSTFTLSLPGMQIVEESAEGASPGPDASASAAHPASTPSSLPHSTPPVVLVVDDVEANRNLLQAFLLSMGLRVLTAVDGITALEILATERVQLVLTDLKMPRLNGRELARAIHRYAAAAVSPGQPVLPAPPIVLVTADASLADFPGHEFVAILEKPIRKACLREMVGRYLPLAEEGAFSIGVSAWADFPPVDFPQSWCAEALHLSKTLRVREVRQFAEKIRARAQASQNEALEDWVRELQEAADSLRIPRLRRLLAQAASAGQPDQVAGDGDEL